jgi:hypothetical protein
MFSPQMGYTYFVGAGKASPAPIADRELHLRRKAEQGSLSLRS